MKTFLRQQGGQVGYFLRQLGGLIFGFGSNVGYQRFVLILKMLDSLAVILPGGHMLLKLGRELGHDPLVVLLVDLQRILVVLLVSLAGSLDIGQLPTQVHDCFLGIAQS